MSCTGRYYTRKRASIRKYHCKSEHIEPIPLFFLILLPALLRYRFRFEKQRRVQLKIWCAQHVEIHQGNYISWFNDEDFVAEYYGQTSTGLDNEQTVSLTKPNYLVFIHIRPN